MAIQNFFTSRDNNLDGNTYVGQLGRLWYNPDTNSIYASDGSTEGGIPVDLATNANITANNLTVNQITSTSGTVTVTGNLTISGNISAATDVKIGGVRAGPGANISNTGLLTIDTTGLPLSFGNFTANNNILTIVNVDENMILATQGNAEIQLVGNIGFYKSNGLPPNVINRYFFARDDGQLRILVPAEDPLEGGVEIIGSSTGNYVTPGAPGTMLQLTGNPNISCRLYQDSLNSYSSFIGRRYNGNTASPGQVLAGEDVLRFNATAATDAGMGNVALAQISITALENQTTTAQGSEITFTVTPVGQPASNRVDVANITVANGVTATQFTTSGNVVANVVSGISGNIWHNGNLLPTDNMFSIGSIDNPWQSSYFGPQSITILDATGNVDNSVVMENDVGNITMAAAGFEILTLDTQATIFRIEALTGQIFSNARTIIENTIDAANIDSGSLQTSGGAGIAKNLYVGGNITAGNLTLSTGGIVSSSGLISTTANILAGNVLSTGAVTSNSAAAGIGYRVGAGGTITQLTDKTTPVTLNTITGEITMNAAQLGGDSTVSFTLNNSQIGNTDLIVLNQVSDANIGVYSFNGQCNSGNALISVHNMTNTNRSDAIVIRFAVIRGAIA